MPVLPDGVRVAPVDVPPRRRWRWERAHWRRTAAPGAAPYVSAERPLEGDDAVVTGERVVPIAVVDERAAWSARTPDAAPAERRVPGPLARSLARALVAIDFALPGRRD